MSNSLEQMGLPSALILLHIKGRIHIIYILLIQFFPELLHAFSKSLEVYDLPLPEELDYVVNFRIVG